MATLRKTRIICTLGPTASSLEQITALVRAGMNIARFNFSHGDHAEHLGRLQTVRVASAETGIPVATMLDTKGPEIRTGTLRGDEKIRLVPGQRIVLTTDEVEGTAERLSISYKELPNEVKVGGHIFLADGLMDLEVESVEGGDIHCVIHSGGLLGSRKNVNVPGVRTSLPAMTAKDEHDIRFAIENDMDFIAASFIRRADDIRLIREFVQSFESPIRLLAKIEDEEGLDNVDEIVRAADGVMVARGDLGVQLEVEEIPMAQKRIIENCNRENKPVITATQMLDSMIQNPNPTRAELTDVANAIFDGTDAVMLSGETANGAYPVRSAEMLSRIALAVERSEEYRKRCAEYFAFHSPSHDIGHSIAKAAYVVASEISAAAIVTPSMRGNSPRIMSKFRPMQNIIAVTTSDRVCRQLLITWGVYPILTGYVRDSELMIQNALRMALKHGFVQRLDRVVTAAGIPVNSPLMLNTIKVHFMGNILNRGQEGFGKVCSGRVVKLSGAPQAVTKLAGTETPQVLLIQRLTRAYLPVLANVRGVISEGPVEVDEHEILAVNPALVVVSEVPEAYEQFEDGSFVSLNGEEKIVYEGLLPEDE